MKFILCISVLFAAVYGEDGSLCYDTYTVNTMCAAGTPLAEKMLAPEVGICSVQDAVSASFSKSQRGTVSFSKSQKVMASFNNFQMRATKEKCPADCVSVDDHFTSLMTNMSGEACFLQALGWMDSNGAMIENEWLPDMDLLPVADMVNRKTMKDCVKEMKADEDFKALRKTCGKCYSNAEEKAMDALEFEFKCFVKLFDGSCADYVNQQIRCSLNSNPEACIWTDEGIVPSRLSQAPNSPLTATWADSGAVAGINSVISSNDMFKKPVISFDADADALYTFMIVDEGIDDNGGIQYFHWMKVNVPGSDLTAGDENMEYVAPFYFKEKKSGTGLINTGDDRGHDILVLAYKQGGSINVEETQSGCNADLLNSRVLVKEVLAEKYGLGEPVAGTFLWTKWADGGAYWPCYFTQCAGFPFPQPAPGVNDIPDCSILLNAE